MKKGQGLSSITSVGEIILTTVTLLVGLSHPSYAASVEEMEPIPLMIEEESGASYDSGEDGSAAGPLFLALFGDSVSIATMADAKFGNPGPRFYADFMRSAGTAGLYEAILGKVRPHPSEAEQHMLLQRHFGNMARIPLSPYLGTQSYSLPVLIKDATGFAPKIYNGAQMAGAYYFGQLYLDRFAQFFARNPMHKKPEIIIVNFNGMDFLADRSTETYAASVRNFYERLTALAPLSSIVVTEIADPIPLLTHPDRVAVPRSPQGPLKCSDLYKIVRLDNSSGLSPESPPAQIELARRRLEQMRGILVNESERMNHHEGAYAAFQGRVIYVPATGSPSDAAEHIAADCIHPDAYLQTLIGIGMWQVVRPLL